MKSGIEFASSKGWTRLETLVASRFPIPLVITSQVFEIHPFSVLCGFGGGDSGGFLDVVVCTGVNNFSICFRLVSKNSRHVCLRFRHMPLYRDFPCNCRRALVTMLSLSKSNIGDSTHVTKYWSMRCSSIVYRSFSTGRGIVLSETSNNFLHGIVGGGSRRRGQIVFFHS